MSSSDEPQVSVAGNRYMPLRDYIVEKRKKTAPHFRSLSVAVSHLSYTVKARRPSSRHNDVLNGCMYWTEDKRKQKKDILHDISFYLRPGEMTLLLGAPGCGKSSVIKLVADRLRTGKVTGTLLYAGKGQRPKRVFQDIAYVPQDDLHIGICSFFF